jgi:predicted ABC-type ATPase
MSAGRVMLSRLKELSSRKSDFAFETTMASRSFAPWLQRLIDEGYRLHLVFLWLSSPETAIARVRARVQAGGHDVPEATIRRRYARGTRNFLDLYRPLASTWRVYDNSSAEGPRLVASGGARLSEEILDDGTWKRIQA